MKKTITVLMITAAFLAGCGSDENISEAPKNNEITVVTETAAAPETAEEPAADEPAAEEPAAEEPAAEEPVVEDIPEEAAAAAPEQLSETEKGSERSSGKPKAIVWLGDSLTQGSLGDEDDNLANAPYVRLSKKVSVPVEGYGFYGHNTHDIFWMYRDETQKGQEIDPDKVYIFWVGSCDWCPDEGPNADTAPVISQIDNFLAQNGGVNNYIVIGTTSRWRLGDLYVPINNDLAAHYGSHYMDCINIINRYGYSEDNTHLSQASYDAIADAVCDKLKALGYI